MHALFAGIRGPLLVHANRRLRASWALVLYLTFTGSTITAKLALLLKVRLALGPPMPMLG